MSGSGQQKNLPGLGMITELPTTRRRGNGNKKAPVKIYSRLFNEDIWLVSDWEEMENLVSRGVKEAVYLAREIPISLEGMDLESLRAVHATKKVFPGSVVV